MAEEKAPQETQKEAQHLTSTPKPQEKPKDVEKKEVPQDQAKPTETPLKDAPQAASLINKKIALIATIVSLALATSLAIAMVVISKQGAKKSAAITEELKELDTIINQIDEDAYPENALNDLTKENTQSTDSADDSVNELDSIDLSSIEDDYDDSTLDGIE